MSEFDWKPEDFDKLILPEEKEGIAREEESALAVAERVAAALAQADQIDIAKTISEVVANDAFMHWLDDVHNPLHKEKVEADIDPPTSDFAPDTAKDQGPTEEHAPDDAYLFSALSDEPIRKELDDGDGPPDDDPPPPEEHDDDDDYDGEGGDDDDGDHGPPLPA